ncbi:hypothetical protein [Micromonospora haikouensis]|uniref:hypothetical protein n=1 Tax=Micromonospora haikouensis TaxID=686309 RepID=UPI003D7457D8
MGASNVLAAYALYAGKVPATSMQLLAYMAAVSKDDDARPWFGRGHYALAEFALGRGKTGPITRADIKAVERAIGPLAAEGAISTDRKASVRRDGAHTVRYRLHLTTPHAPRKTGDDTESQDPPRPPENGHHVPRNSSPRPPETVLTSPENRVTEEPGGDTRSEKTQEEEIAVRTDLAVARAREADANPDSTPDPPSPPTHLRVIEGNPTAPGPPRNPLRRPNRAAQAIAEATARRQAAIAARKAAEAAGK